MRLVGFGGVDKLGVTTSGLGAVAPPLHISRGVGIIPAAGGDHHATEARMKPDLGAPAESPLRLAATHRDACGIAIGEQLVADRLVARGSVGVGEIVFDAEADEVPAGRHAGRPHAAVFVKVKAAGGEILDLIDPAAERGQDGHAQQAVFNLDGLVILQARLRIILQRAVEWVDGKRIDVVAIEKGRQRGSGLCRVGRQAQRGQAGGGGAVLH